MTAVALDPPEGRDAWTFRSQDGRTFAVFKVRGEYFVTDAHCPHNRGPLDQGWVRHGRTLICPWHWYRFDLRTGRCETSSRYTLGVYPVVERDGKLYAEIGKPPAKRSWSDILRSHARDAG